MKTNITSKTLFWIAMDLVALSFVAGLLLVFYGTAVGWWQPFGEMFASTWPLLAFGIWVVVAFCLGTLAAVQCHFMIAARSAATGTMQPSHTLAFSAGPELAREVTAAMRPRIDPREIITSDAHHEDEVEEPVLVSA